MRGICAAVIGLSLAAITTAGAAEPLTKPFAYDNVHIRVADPQKAAEWYVKALGAKPSEAPTPQTAQVSFGAQAITITKGDSTASSMGTLIDHFGLSFSDLDAAVKQALTRSYGAPADDRTLWENDLYQPLPDYWGVAVQLGHLRYAARWDTAEGTISLELTGNHHSRLTIEYRSAASLGPSRNT